MPVTAAQKDEIQQVIDALLKPTASRGKRRLADMFLELVDREHWPEYYEVIPQPRCINGVKDSLGKNKYKNALQAYEDLTLVFLNALYYNEESSQIAKDATTLRTILDEQWKLSPNLPHPPSSPPASSAQMTKNTRTLPAASAPAPTPAPASKPQPIAGPSTPLRAQSKPKPQPQSRAPAPALAALPPSSPERHSSPDIDVDIGGTPEPEVISHETARDGESDAIVKQLERGLPRWEGFADVGWASGVTTERALGIVTAIKEFQDASGTRISTSLEALPEETTIPDLSFSFSLSLAMIETKARDQVYESSEAFDKDMSNLFLKARRSYEPASDAYGHVLHLQRLYHALTSPTPPSGPPYTSPIHFASLRAGPGNVKPLHTIDAEGVPGVTSFRVSNRERTFVESVQFKGWTVKVADWLHLSNPDDPGRPIIAQVFKCWLSEEPSKKGQPWITVSWYYRPEQTFHPANRQFWDKEVFKTSHFAEHPIEDIIEKIACQFTARHIRGRPRPPFWYPSWPLYVCDSRYNDRERIFVKIKNWNSCVPEEVRKSEEFMPIYPFERSVFPYRLPSPFVSGAAVSGKVPGGIGNTLERAEGEKLEGGGVGRKRPKRNVTTRSEQTDKTGPSRGVYVGAGGVATAQATAAAVVQQQYAPGPSQPQYQAPPVQQPRDGADRSLVTALGGMAALGNNVNLEKLPLETAKHFDRDPETNEVLWFATPPIDMAHQPGPRHSLAYLHHLAKKRKLAKDRAIPAATTMDVDDVDTESNDGRRRKAKTTHTPGRTVTETVNALLVEFGLE
ncbi:hypothetical protein EIP91_010388 [Steccherinum ochraceum]|uniref:Chromatin structure-remodeling complex protein rsc1 n=1 Tax=Steccherinum ochraceum TaxID=92696 RepID=A0A4V2MX38_9APHY|nr:hypothetical protein EIP91_010388 [Steccherinum ochraceum]